MTTQADVDKVLAIIDAHIARLAKKKWELQRSARAAYRREYRRRKRAALAVADAGEREALAK